MKQLSLFAGAPPGPPGFVYVEDLLARAEEEALLPALARLEYEAFLLHGVAARRRVAYFGHGYGPDRRDLRPGAPLPPFLLPLRERCAALAGEDPARLEMASVIQYPPGAGIGWHRDAPPFETVAGVSLLAPCRFKLRPRGDAAPRRPLELALAPRSGYVLAGAARWRWEHAIPPVETLRYSVTFRTLRARRAAAR